jgi:hypothetical protein
MKKIIKVPRIYIYNSLLLFILLAVIVHPIYTQENKANKLIQEKKPINTNKENFAPINDTENFNLSVEENLSSEGKFKKTSKDLLDELDKETELEEKKINLEQSLEKIKSKIETLKNELQSTKKKSDKKTKNKINDKLKAENDNITLKKKELKDIENQISENKKSKNSKLIPLLGETKKALSELSEEISKNTGESTEKDPAKGQESKSELNGLEEFYPYILSILIVIVGVFIGFTLYYKNSLKEANSHLKDLHFSQNSSEKDKERKYKLQIEILTREKNELLNKLDRLQAVSNVSGASKVESRESSNSKPTERKVYYCAIPDENQFISELKIKENRTREYYEIQSDGVRHYLTLAKDSIRETLQNKDIILEPACEILGDRYGKDSITVDTPGILEKMSGGYRLVNKIKVRIS